MATPAVPIPSYAPPPQLPHVADEPVVTEALDLLARPELGPRWNASGGDIPKGYLTKPFVTPCGVFVSVVEGRDSLAYPGDPTPQARIVGVDIRTGKLAWSRPLTDVTGQSAPVVQTVSVGQSGEIASYTSDCHMLLTFFEAAGLQTASGPHVLTVSVDLKTGATGTLPGRYCAAAGEKWATCLVGEGVAVFDLSRPGNPKSWSKPGGNASYRVAGDTVVAGLVWTAAGYRAPDTGRVVFGADTQTALSADKSVVYVEPRTPGGYRSGLVVRASGPRRNGVTGDKIDGCQAVLWDPVHGKARWNKPASIPCGSDGDFESVAWAISGQALIVRAMQGHGSGSATWNTSVYSLADGAFLWRSAYEAGSTGWRDREALAMPGGVSQAYVDFWEGIGTHHTLRIADGAEVTLGYGPAVTLENMPRVMAATTAYDYHRQDAPGRKLVASVLDPANPTATPIDAWTLSLPEGFNLAWTFATGGVMYVVMTDASGWLYVSPLVA